MNYILWDKVFEYLVISLCIYGIYFFLREIPRSNEKPLSVLSRIGLYFWSIFIPYLLMELYEDTDFGYSHGSILFITFSFPWLFAILKNESEFIRAKINKKI